MILVDTSVWIQHLRRADATLISLIENDLVVCHPFVIGELAMGSIKKRSEFLGLLGTLPLAATAAHAEGLALVHKRSLHGRGLAACAIGRLQLWTLDRSLARTADDLRVRFSAGWSRL